MKSEILTQDDVRALLDYDPRTGLFTQLIRTSQRVHVGDLAGTLAHGYRKIVIRGRMYKLHRIAWLWMTGEWPRGDIDHINMDKSDNRWCNLREATRSQNHANRPPLSTNTSGFKGVSWNKSHGKWKAAISVRNKSITIGRFSTAREAHVAYIAAARKYFGEFSRHQ